MKRFHSLRIGQLVALGFGLTLLLALLIALALISAYVISKQQSQVIQNRAVVESLAQQLEILSTQRSEFLRRYLETGDKEYLTAFQSHEIAFESNAREISALLGAPEEQQALQAANTAEDMQDQKAQESLRLYDSNFPVAARLLWATEGSVARDNLVEAIEKLRQVQGDTSARLINQAHQVENLSLTIAIIFVVLALIAGLGASLLITRTIAIPISNLVGTVITLGSDLSARSEASGPQEIAFLGETVNSMAVHLQNSRYALQQHYERMTTELSLASQMQASLLPSTLPPPPGWELAVFWQSAREMGGDFYTMINLGQGRRGIAIGDVNGKGASAAMAGALTVGLLEAHAPLHTSPERLLAQLNDDLYLRFHANRMNVACCYLIVDESSSRLRVANAGFIFPYIRRDNSIIEVQIGGMPLGAWPQYHYRAQSLALRPGDLLLLSSDGLVEARNGQGEMFGFDRLQSELLRLPAELDAQSALNHMLSAVRAFIDHTELQDDLTIMLARVKE
ncbi:MAG: SpoIIE family protein phosphatase [Anaerolineae bacterium]